MLQKMKKMSAAFASAKCRTALLCLALVAALALSVVLPMAVNAASNRQAVQESLDRTSDTLEAADAIYHKLREIIADEIDAMDVEDSDPDLDEAEEGYRELNGYIQLLDELITDLGGLSDDLNTSDGKTVRAAKEYLSMLRNMTADLSELVRYSIDMYHAIEPMSMMDADTDDFEDLAEGIWYGCEATRILMEEIRPPAYLAITHADMITRITEFRDFGEDFYYACYMEDPLRMYSCVYRMNRIIRMFDICDENLTADMELQFRQAEHRLDGPIAQLRQELITNIDLLNNAQRRGR